jgi:hypothetical protein
MCLKVGRLSSSVSIVTRLWARWPRNLVSFAGRDRDFSPKLQYRFWVPHTSFEMLPGIKVDVKMSSHFTLEHNLRMDGDIPPLPPCFYKAWSLIKYRDNFTCFAFISESNARILNHRQWRQHQQIHCNLHSAFQRWHAVKWMRDPHGHVTEFIWRRYSSLLLFVKALTDF